MGQKETKFYETIKEYQEEWDLDNEQMDSAVKYMIKDKVSTNMSKLRLFLYAKGIMFRISSRKHLYNDILHPRNVYMKEALERLKAIVEKGESPARLFKSSKIVTLFDLFIEDHPEWKEGKSVFVVHRDHPALAGKPHALVERHQKKGLCYMHAPIVLQHYLVAMHTDEAVPMLDMAKYLRMKLNSTALYEHIWNNRGGNSIIFLEQILSYIPEEFMPSVRNDKVIIQNLHRFGPALLVGFRVTQDFLKPFSQYLGIPKGKVEGLHAMLLIGYRRIGDETRYLIQNWWFDKPYVEVDLNYLRASKALIYFIEKEQTRMSSFANNDEQYVECDQGMDAAETSESF